MADIFLSYSERDREAARRIAELLESSGWSVWWDRRIPAGENWRNLLDRALETTRCMVVLGPQTPCGASGCAKKRPKAVGSIGSYRFLSSRLDRRRVFAKSRPPTLWVGDELPHLPRCARTHSRDSTDRLGKPVAASEAVVESEQRGRVSRSQVGTATEKLDGVASEASGDVGHRRPRQAESPWRFAPWLVGGALALAAGAIFMSSLGKQAHRELETAPSFGFASDLSLFIPTRRGKARRAGGNNA